MSVEFRPGVLAFAHCRLRYWTAGAEDAPWVVVTHGGALDHTSFRPLVSRLADRRRWLLWDLPGHGRSQPMPNAFTARLCADALEAVMDAAGVDRALQFGFSFGGVVAQLFARAHPSRTEGLIAYGCFTPHGAAAPMTAADARSTAEGVFGALSWPDVQAAFAGLCSSHAEVQAAIREQMAPLGKDGFLAMTTALLSAAECAPDFRVEGPMLIVHGDSDSNGQALAAAVADLQARHPHATTTVIEGAGHNAHEDQPDAFAAAIELFLGTADRTAASTG